MSSPVVIVDSPVHRGPPAGPSSRSTADHQGRKRQRAQRDTSAGAPAAEAHASASQPFLDLTKDNGASTSRAPDVVDLTSLDDDVVLVGQVVPKKKKPQLKQKSPLGAASSSRSPQEDDRYKCPICLEKFQNAVSTPCGHVYCAECLHASLKVNKKCPKCRKTVQPRQVHRLYLE